MGHYPLPMDIAILGGGISGLAASRRLLQAGHRVTLYEAAAGLGGLGSTFRSHEGHELERFYHCLLPTDDALLAHVRELGLEDRVHWRETHMGFTYAGDAYALNTPLDLLRFAPLRMHERLRLGLLAVRARLYGNHPSLDDVTAADWLRQTIGDRAFEVLWKPLLSAKIGDHYPHLPALWLSSRLHREKNVSKEEKGCIEGGYRALADAFATDLRERGAAVKLNTAVRSLEWNGDSPRVTTQEGQVADYDAIVSTLPLPVFQQLSRPLDLHDSISKLELDYQGVVSAVFLTDEPLTDHYWTPWVECGTQSQGLIAMSALVPPEWSGGRHVNYVVNYVHRDTAFFAKSDEELLEAYRDDLTRMHPSSEGHVIEGHLFRAPYVEPMWTTGYASRKPAYAAVPGRVYLSCTAQLYPRVNSWNASCEMVEELIQTMAADQGQRAAA